MSVITRLRQILVIACLSLGFSLVLLTVHLNSAVAWPISLLEHLQIGQEELELLTAVQPRGQEQTGMAIYLDSPTGIHIISDRQETVAEFFQRHRIVVGMTTSQDLNRILTVPPETQDFFVAYPSSNHDQSGQVTSYRLSFRLAPVTTELVQLWQTHLPKAASVYVFLERNPGEELDQLVGWAEREQFSFDSEEALPVPLKPEDLRYRGGSDGQ